MAGMEKKAKSGLWANLPLDAGQKDGIASPANIADDFDGQNVEVEVGGSNKNIISGGKHDVCL